MGLDTTHDAWHGAYSAFNRWRCTIAAVAGLPPLELMEGFFDATSPVCGNPFWKQYDDDKNNNYTGPFSVWARLPVKWSCLQPSALHILLHHSDCEGEIEWPLCAPIADELEKLLPLLPKEKDVGHIGDWREKTQQFINGLRAAYAAKENLGFH